MMLEVTMADHPGCPCPPVFSWNAGMVMHVLKSDPVLSELEHVQVDCPGTAYLFFYEKQGCQGYRVCDLGSHGGGFLRVDLTFCSLYH